MPGHKNTEDILRQNHFETYVIYQNIIPRRVKHALHEVPFYGENIITTSAEGALTDRFSIAVIIKWPIDLADPNLLTSTHFSL